MKRLMFLAAAAAILFPATAATWTLKGETYTVDTLQHYQAGPGTTVTVVDLNGPVKQRVWYSTTDLSNPDLAIRTIIGNDIRKSRLTVPQLVESKKDDGNIYFLGVNADLFSTLGPIGTTICNGDILKIAKSSTAWKAVGQDENGALHYGSANIVFSASINGDRAYAPSLINVPRYKGESNCILYTYRYGASTETNKLLDQSSGKWIDNTSEVMEIVLRPEGGILRSDGPTACTVVSAPVKSTAGNTAIPEGCFVLSTNASDQFSRFSAFKAGDTYTLTPSGISLNGIGYGISHSFSKVTELCGGDPVLLENGQRLSSYASMPNYNTRRPRTAIGTDASRTKMTLLVVDGDKFNKGISAGADAQELVDMMLALGCTDALNFDGGGSSTMFSGTFGVLNRPSDGHNRAVCNAWFLTTPNKGDLTVDRIEFVNPRRTFDKGESFTPLIYGYNAAGLPVNTDIKDFTIKLPEDMAAYDGNVITLTGDGTFLVEAEWEGKCCTMAIRSGQYSAVERIAASDASPSYFDLKGMPVGEPDKGVYIRRQGNKTDKIIVN